MYREIPVSSIAYVCIEKKKGNGKILNMQMHRASRFTKVHVINYAKIWRAYFK